MVKSPPASAREAGDMGSISGSGRSSGRGKENPSRILALEIFMDRGALWAALMGVERAGHNWARNTHVQTIQG